MLAAIRDGHVGPRGRNHNIHTSSCSKYCSPLYYLELRNPRRERRRASQSPTCHSLDANDQSRHKKFASAADWASGPEDASVTSTPYHDQGVFPPWPIHGMLANCMQSIAPSPRQSPVSVPMWSLSNATVSRPLGVVEEATGHLVQRSAKRPGPPMNADGRYYCNWSEECADQVFHRKSEWRYAHCHATLQIPLRFCN